MTEETQTAPEPAGETPTQSPLDAHRASEEAGGDPLPLVGAAFAGGFVLAQVLKRLGGER